MVAFNVAQLSAFFANASQMGLPPNVQARLSSEGLDTIEDFEDFKEEELKAAFRNMRTSIPGLQAVPEQLNAAGDVIAAAIPPVPGILPCLVSARCALCLNVASNAYHYYASIDRVTTPTNMNYNGILKVFHVK